MSGSAPTRRRRSSCISASARGSACAAAIAGRGACGAIIGFLAFRFGVAGVYFAILTIAFAEFARIGFDHLGWTGGSAGLFLPVAQYTHNDLWRSARPAGDVLLRDPAGSDRACLRSLCRALLQSRIGYFWLAIREDEEAARALGIDTFRYKMMAVVISAGMTSFAGVFYAFYYNNLFPEQVFHILRSIEIILGPIVGGVGTLFGPILGAFMLTGFGGDAHRGACRRSASICPAPSRCSTAFACCWWCMALPDGMWPWLAPARSACRSASNDARFCHDRGRQQALPRPRRGRSASVSRSRRAAIFARDRAERRRQDHAVQHDCRRASRRTAARSPLRASGSTGCRPTRSAGAASAAPSRSCGRFRRSRVEDNVIVGALLHRHDVVRRAHMRTMCCGGSISTTSARNWPSALTLPDRKRLEVARALATDPKLLLLDEVMAGLRPTETDRMVAILKELNRDTGLTILLIEHVMRAVMALAATRSGDAPRRGDCARCACGGGARSVR